MTYSEEELIEELHRVSEEYCDGKSPRQKDMNKKGNCSIQPYYNVFGSWNDALEECDFERNYIKNISEEKLLKEIKRISIEYCDGNTPKQIDMREHGQFGSSTYRKRFGCWSEALAEAGFELNRQNDYTREELLKEIKRVSTECLGGDTPTANDITEYGKYSCNSYLRNFKSWNSALKMCGFELNHREVSDESILNDIKRIAEIVDDSPTLSDIDKYGKYSNSLYKSRWGTWNNALCEAGFEKNKFSKNSPKGKNHPHWRGGGEKYFGTSWNRQKEKTLNRDEYRCRVTGKDEEEIGVKPHVHHINPRRNWDVNREHKEMNSLDNLITLCPSVHHKVEGKWKNSTPKEFEEKARAYLNIDSR